MKTIEVREIEKVNNPILIDIRNFDNYILGHIDGAINVPMNELLYNTKEYLDFDHTYYIYCEIGFTSSKVCNILNKDGYKTISINGGYKEYKLYNKIM